MSLDLNNNKQDLRLISMSMLTVKVMDIKDPAIFSQLSTLPIMSLVKWKKWVFQLNCGMKEYKFKCVHCGRPYVRAKAYEKHEATCGQADSGKVDLKGIVLHDVL